MSIRKMFYGDNEPISLGLSQLNPETQEKATPDILSGEEVAVLTSELYNRLSERLNYRLVDSNVALTLAGLKPATYFVIDVKNENDAEELKQELNQVNSYLSGGNNHIRFSVEGRQEDENKAIKKSIIFVRNLAGYERVTNSTKIKQIPHFMHTEGFEGLSEWQKQVFLNLYSAKQNGDIPEFYDIDSMAEGIEYGYPDTAIRDMETWDHGGRPEGNISDTNIPYTGMYQEAEPNFAYLTEHADDEGIRNYVTRATNILKGFYESEWHKNMEPKLAFHKRQGK